MHHIQHNSFVMPNFIFNSASISFISSSVRLYFCESLLSSILIYKYVMFFLTCSFIIMIFTSRLKDMDRRRIAPPPAIRFVFQLHFPKLFLSLGYRAKHKLCMVCTSQDFHLPDIRPGNAIVGVSLSVITVMACTVYR